MSKFYHVTEDINVFSILANGLEPTRGHRTLKRNDPPAIYLFPSYEDAETAMTNWLPDEFDDDAELVMLEIDIPEYDNNAPHIERTHVEWECVCYDHIPAKYISVMDVDM